MRDSAWGSGIRLLARRRGSSRLAWPCDLGATSDRRASQRAGAQAGISHGGTRNGVSGVETLASS